MEKDKLFIELNEVGDTALKLIGSKELEKLFENCENANQDFRQGAMWGMAILSTYLGAYSKKYNGIDKNELDTVIWHDCKIDPPKESGFYILVYKVKPNNNICWDSAFYSDNNNQWEDAKENGNVYKGMYEPIKWAEINLLEVKG